MAWRPHPAQERFLRASEGTVLFGGAAGPGKSAALVADVSRGLVIPYYRGILFRKTRMQSTDLILKAQRLLGSAFPYARWNGQEHAFVCPNKARLEIGYLRNDMDLENLQGQEWQYIGVDEAGQFPKHHIDYMYSRLRGGDNPLRPLRLTANPGGIGHLWLREEFVDAGPPETTLWSSFTDPTGKKMHRSSRYIPARLEDNPSVGVEYEIALSMLPPKLYQALRMGDWNALIGAAFSDFDFEVHVLTQAKFAEMHGLALDHRGVAVIPAHWPIFTSFDWGKAKPFSWGWWTVDPYGRLYRIAEWYGCERNRDGKIIANKGMDMDTRTIAEGIKEREIAMGIWGRPQLRICDPACWSKTGLDGTGPSIAEVFGEEHLYLTRGDNSRIAGKQQFHDRFRLYDLQLLSGEVVETPGVFILDNCKDGFLRTVPVMPLDVKNPEDVDTDAEDHAYDEARYMFMARPWAPGKQMTKQELRDAEMATANESAYMV